MSLKAKHIICYSVMEPFDPLWKIPIEQSDKAIALTVGSFKATPPVMGGVTTFSSDWQENREIIKNSLI